MLRRPQPAQARPPGLAQPQPKGVGLAPGLHGRPGRGRFQEQSDVLHVRELGDCRVESRRVHGHHPLAAQGLDGRGHKPSP